MRSGFFIFILLCKILSCITYIIWIIDTNDLMILVRLLYNFITGIAVGFILMFSSKNIINYAYIGIIIPLIIFIVSMASGCYQTTSGLFMIINSVLPVIGVFHVLARLSHPLIAHYRDIKEYKLLSICAKNMIIMLYSVIIIVSYIITKEYIQSSMIIDNFSSYILLSGVLYLIYVILPDHNHNIYIETTTYLYEICISGLLFSCTFYFYGIFSISLFIDFYGSYLMNIIVMIEIINLYVECSSIISNEY